MRGVLTGALTQGLGVATGLQANFNWASVASAGVSAGVSADVGENLPSSLSQTNGIIVANTAGAIAGAVANSVVSGTDFGTSLIEQLPQDIGNTIGSAFSNSPLSLDTQPQYQVTPVAPADLQGAPADPGSLDSSVPNISIDSASDIEPAGTGLPYGGSGIALTGPAGLSDGVYYVPRSGLGSLLNDGVYNSNQPISLTDASGNGNSNFLSYGQMQSLVPQNNLYSSNLPNNILIALAFKESSFNADAVDGNFLGLGQDNSVAVNDINNQYNKNYTYGNSLFDPSTSIQVASLALDLKDTYTGGNGFNDPVNLDSSNESWFKALSAYRGDKNPTINAAYANSIIQAANYLNTNPTNPIPTLNAILHPSSH